MEKKHATSHPDDGSVVIVKDEYLIKIFEALQNLIGTWKKKVKCGTVKLEFAVEIGSKLSAEQQHRLSDFLSHNSFIQMKHQNKVLLAFTQNMPEWAIIDVLHIYDQAEKLKLLIVMHNDLMDEYERIFEDFQYHFLKGKMPQDEDHLQDTLKSYKKRLQALQEQMPNRTQDYNKTYGDSSSSRKQSPALSKKAKSFRQLIGAPEEASFEGVKKQYRHLMKILHPDRGGSAYLFDLVKKAYESEKKYL